MMGRPKRKVDEQEYYRLKKLGMKKKDIIARLGVSRSTFSRWEKGQTTHFRGVKPQVRGGTKTQSNAFIPQKGTKTQFMPQKVIDRCKWLAGYFMFSDDLWMKDDLEIQRLEICLRRYGLSWEDWYDYWEIKRGGMT